MAGVDDVRFRSRADGGTEVEWNATFRLRGPGRFTDPVLESGFKDVAAKAVAGFGASLRALAQR